MTLSKAARDGWNDVCSNLTWRQRADLLATLGATNTGTALVADLVEQLHVTHEGNVGDWTILNDAGPLDRDALITHLDELARHMDRYSNDHEQATRGLLIALLRYLQPDAELYDQARSTLRAVVKGYASFTTSEEH